MSEEPSLNDNYEEERKDELNGLLASIRGNDVTRVSWFSADAAEALCVARALESNTSVKEFGVQCLDTEGAKALAAALGSKECAIARLELERDQMDDDGVVALADALERNTTLTRLGLRRGTLSSEAFKRLARALKHHASITEFVLFGDGIDVEGASALGNALQSNTALKVLRLEYSFLGDEGAIALARGLSRVTSLNLSGNRIRERGVAAIAEAIERGGVIVELDLSYNPIGAAGAQALGRALVGCPNLTSLDLRGAVIGSEGAQGLAAGVAISKSLLNLLLRSSDLGDAGALAIAQAVEHNASMTMLSLIHSGITFPGVQAIASLLVKNSTLFDLNLSENPIGAEGANELCKALEKNTTLSALRVSSCRITSGVEIASRLEKTSSVATLAIGSNPLSQQGAEALFRALAKNSSLTSLDISGIDLGPVTGTLATALESNRSLALLQMFNCGVEGEDRERFLAALKKNPVLTEIHPSLSGRSELSDDLLVPNQDRRARFVEALLHGSVDEARQFVEEGVDLHSEVRSEGDWQDLLLAVLKVDRLDSFGMLLQTRFARSLLFNTMFMGGCPAIVHVLKDELWRFPRHEGIMARLEELVGNNSYLAGLLGQVNCRHAARALYGVLRKRFKVAWCSSDEPNTFGSRDSRGEKPEMNDEGFLPAIAGDDSSECDEVVEKEKEDEDEEEDFKDFDALLRSIRCNKAMRVCPYRIPEVDSLRIAHALERNTSVTELRLETLSVGGANSLALALGSKGCALATLQLHNTHMGDEGMVAIANALGRNTSVRSLRFSWNKFSTVAVRALARALERNSTVKELSWEGETLDVEGATIMAQAMQRNASLIALNLRENVLEDEGAVALAPGLSRIKYLKVVKNRIRDSGLAAIAEAIARGNTTTMLELGSNFIGEEGGQALGRLLERSSRLTSLDVSYADLEIEGAKGLASGLAKSSLLNLSLRAIALGDAGAAVVAAALEENVSLTTINLADTGTREVGARALAKALEKNVTLARLVLSRNPIYEGADALCKALERNRTLTSLSIDGCEVADAHAIASMLEKNVSIAALQIGGHEWDAQSMEVLGTALTKNSSVTFLDLSRMLLGSDGVRAVARALETNSSLAILETYGCGLKGECAERVVAALKKNVVVTKIWPSLSGCGESSEGIIARNTGRRDCFVEALLHGSLDEARQFVEEGVDLHSDVGGEDVWQTPLLATLEAGRLDSFEVLLQTRFARSLLLCAWEDVPVVVRVLRDELWRFPRHEGAMARLRELVGSNVHLAGLLGQVDCRHAARALYGVLRKRFKVAWSSGGGEGKPIPRDMARMLAQHVWQSRFAWRK